LFSSWTELIYFSQSIVKTEQFGRCYQTNDPTAEDFFDLLPTDGGIINIQGSGSIYKLFPVQNGLLVFAANGIWFITGSQGIGFTANDYTITKISGIKSISSYSFVDVNGWPLFWNEEGIYGVSPSQQGGGLTVESLTVSTILSFYAQIPMECKKYARASYDPINYIVQWVYAADNGATVNDRYTFTKALCLNTHTKSFYPYSISTGVNQPYVTGILYVSSPGGTAAPDPTFKYFTQVGATFTFSEERDSTNWLDWFTYTNVGVDYSSYFTTGYKLHGQVIRGFNVGYLYIYSNNAVNTQYRLQSLLDYAINRNSGRYSSIQLITNDASTTNFGKVIRRHRLRGHGHVMQYKVQSVTGHPFDIDGWAVWEEIDQGV